MIGPQLQIAIRQTLKAAGVADGRVYDDVKRDPVFPYVTLGDEQTNDDSDTCREFYEQFADVHVFSRAHGRTEAKAVGEAVRQALTEPLSVDQYEVISQQFRTGQVFRDPDGITAHAVLTFRFLLQPAT